MDLRIVSVVCGLAAALLSSASLCRAEEAPEAIGTADACNASGYCETFEQRYATMPGCQVGLMRDLPDWLSRKPGEWRLRGPMECRPANQRRA